MKKPLGSSGELPDKGGGGQRPGGPDADGAAPAESGTEAAGLDALREELEQIFDEGVEEALGEQRKGFEREYSRLWDSRSFWRRVAVGEGTAIVACLLGGFFVWNWSR